MKLNKPYTVNVNDPFNLNKGAPRGAGGVTFLPERGSKIGGGERSEKPIFLGVVGFTVCFIMIPKV